MRFNNLSVLICSILAISFIFYEWNERGLLFAVALIPVVGKILWRIINGNYSEIFCGSDLVSISVTTTLAVVYVFYSTPLLHGGYYESQQKALYYIANANYGACNSPYDRFRLLSDSARDACLVQSDVDLINLASDVQKARLDAGGDAIKLIDKINRKQHVNKCEEDYLKLNALCPSEYPAVQFPH